MYLHSTDEETEAPRVKFKSHGIVLALKVHEIKLL